jgi:hypothetical protein
MRGVSANVMAGQHGFFGTNAFQVLMDNREMLKLVPPPTADPSLDETSMDTTNTTDHEGEDAMVSSSSSSLPEIDLKNHVEYLLDPSAVHSLSVTEDLLDTEDDFEFGF